jgi:hypothetical protein
VQNELQDPSGLLIVAYSLSARREVAELLRERERESALVRLLPAFAAVQAAAPPNATSVGPSAAAAATFLGSTAVVVLVFGQQKRRRLEGVADG